MEIDGYGIFMKEDISKDTELGITHVCNGQWIRTPLASSLIILIFLTQSIKEQTEPTTEF